MKGEKNEIWKMLFDRILLIENFTDKQRRAEAMISNQIVFSTKK